MMAFSLSFVCMFIAFNGHAFKNRVIFTTACVSVV